jgi:hypothetical protein
MAGKKDIVEQALKLIAGGGAESTATAAARAAENAALLKNASRLGFDTNDVGALKEAKSLTDFHSKFMGDVRTRAQELSEVRRQLQEQGAFPMEVGTRYTTEHSRRTGQPPWTVTNYYVDQKNPQGNYGYYVRRELPDGGYEESISKIRDPKLEALHGPEKWEELQRGFVPMTGPRVVKEGGGEVDPYADEVASGKALMAEKQYDEQSWGDWAGDAVGNALNTAKAILPTALGGEGSVGISDIARGAYEGAKDAVTFPGDVISGKQPLYDESGRPLESAVGRSFNTVGAVGGASSLVPVPDNSLRVFGGIKSKTADKNALTKAQIMQSQGGYHDPNGSFKLTGGNTRDDIWKQAGWGRGAEGGWRYEIPDVGTTVDPAKFQLDLSTATIPSGMKTTLSEYINHPELFDAYPEFKNMVVKGYYEDSGTNGYYMPRFYRGTINPGFSDPYIALNLKNLTTVEAQRATLLHEIQHAIQQKEGFVPGTSQRSRPLETPNPRYATYMDALNNDPEMKDLQSLFATDEYKAESAAKALLFAEYKKIVAELDAKQATTGVNTHNEYIDATNDFFSKTDGKFPLSKKAAQIGFSLEDRGIPSAEPPEFLDQFGAYWADAGEVEARNVQNRRDGPREELKERAPWRTQDNDLPYEAQLIDWNDTSWRKGYSGRGRVIGDVVDQALKLVMGSGDDAAKRISNIQKSDPFPVDYIEPGSLRYKYEHPDTSSFMEIITRPKGARSASVIGLEVPEEYRGTGIGKALQERVLQDFPSLMGQVSSKAAAVNAYKAGRRPLSNPNATIEDVFKMIDEDSSVNLATPKNTGGSVREGYAGRGFVNDKNVEAALKYLRREFGNLPSAPVDEAFRLEGRKLIDKSRNFESGVPILGNERFGTPMSEMQAEYDQVRNLKDYLSKRPHDLVKENAVIYPAIGDLSAAGKRLTKVGDKPLVTPTDLHGGFEFSRDVFGSGDNPASWAGRQGAAKTMADRLSSRTNEGEVPYLSSYTMGPQAVDSTHMVANTIINMMPNAKVAAADIARFDAEMKRDYPGWPGIMKTQKALEFMNARNRPGTHLSDFAKKLDKKEYRASGFPDVGEIRFAVSEPRLLGVPAGSTGFSMMKVKPTAETSTEGIQHGTYTNKIQSPEGYSGGFENVTPSRIMFPEWFDKLHPNAKIDSQKAYQSAMTQFPKQKATNEWADNIEKYWAENPTPWGYAEGGSVEDEDSWFDSAMTIARNAADKATFGTAKYAAAGADYLTDAALDAVGYENDADFDRALAEQEYAMKEGEEKNPAAAGAGDVLGYVAPYLAIGPAEGALSTLGYLSDYGNKVGKTGSLFARALGYADGGEVDDDIYHAVRLSRDVGGATNENPQVMMTDANGVQYDATGKVIQTATPQANSNSSAAPSPTTPQEVGRRAAEDPATFDAMMERYAVPDRDIVDYEALKKEVSQQPQQVQQMTHVGAPPMRDIKVDMPLFGGEYNVGQAPYDIANPMSGVAQTAYDFKTVPLYFTPMTAPIGAGMDVAEGVATGDPLTASLAIGFGPGGKMAKAAGIGAANYFIDPSEAEAGPARWFSKAMEVASALPMEKMTGQQALAMLRKGTSPEELRWTGAENFLSSRPQVSKSELVEYLNKNRVQLGETVLGGEKPSELSKIMVQDIPKTIRDKYMPEYHRLIEQKVKLNSEIKTLKDKGNYIGTTDYMNLSDDLQEIYGRMDKVSRDMRQEYADSIGGLGKPTKYEGWSTSGGKGYTERLYTLGNKPKYTVGKSDGGLWSVLDESGNVLKNDEGKPYTYWSEDSARQASKSLVRESGSYKSSHWDDPDVIAHARSQTLTYDKPGLNRPYTVHNIDETQSDWGQDVRKRGMKDPSNNWRARYDEAVKKNKDDWVEQKATAAFEAAPNAYDNDIEKARAWAKLHAQSFGASGISQQLGRHQEYLDLYNKMKKEGDAVAAGPFVGNTEGWTDLAIKKQIDSALDSSSDYFSWTPGQVHADRYDLSRHIGKIEYNPDDGSFLAYDPSGKMVFNESVNDPSDLDEYVGKELGDKIRAEEETRRSSLNDSVNIDKNEDGDWGLFMNGEQMYTYGGEPLTFGLKNEAKDYLRQMQADEFSNNPVRLEGLDIKTGGEGMIGYYDKVFPKRVQEVIRKATGAKPEIEVITVQTGDGSRQQLGIKLTDEMREKARFSDFNRGGTVTAPSSYGNDDPAVSRAIALTREY